MLTELTTRSAQLFEWFGAAQTSSMKQVGGAFKIDMAQYFELQAFSQFAADIGPETQVRLAKSFTSCWQHSVDTTASADTLPVESGLFRRDVDSTAEKAVWSLANST